MSIFSFTLKVSVVAGLLSSLAITPSYADPVERGFQGAIGGAIIGGIIGGGKGAGRGAVIGGTVGIIRGAMEREDRIRDREYVDRYYYYDDVKDRSSPLVEAIQGSLVRLGYKPGPIDGVLGSRTAGAIGKYQNENGLLVTGQPSKALLSHLKKNGG